MQVERLLNKCDGSNKCDVSICIALHACNTILVAAYACAINHVVCGTWFQLGSICIHPCMLSYSLLNLAVASKCCKKRRKNYVYACWFQPYEGFGEKIDVAISWPHEQGRCQRWGKGQVWPYHGHGPWWWCMVRSKVTNNQKSTCQSIWT
jgi:hypothetical protein